MSDVQSRHCRPAAAEALEYRPRSAVSIQPLARQPARTPNRGGQVGSVRARFASVRRTADRTVRREYLDRVFFWNVADLMWKLKCTVRSTVPRQRNAPVQNPLLLLRLIDTLGSSIAVGCFRHRSPPDCEFAPHTCENMPRP